MKKYLLSLFILGMQVAWGQPTIQWQKSFGGTSGDWATSVQQTSDHGYILAGKTYSNDNDVTGNHGNNDYWIVKIDSIGAIQWQKCLGGTRNDEANAIEQTTDGGFIVAGSSSSNDGDVSDNHDTSAYDFWIVKINSVGNIQWQKTFGGTLSDVATCVHQTIDGGYIVAGYSSSTDGDISNNYGSTDFWVVKIDSVGVIQWEQSYGGGETDVAKSIAITSDGGYIVAGRALSDSAQFNYFIVKINSVGTIQWQETYGGSLWDDAYSIIQANDGGYVATGISTSHDGDVIGIHGASDGWILKLDVNGIIQWKKCIGGSSEEYAYSIIQNLDGGFVISGTTLSQDGDVLGNHGSYDSWIVKLDSNGTIKWQKCLGGTWNDYANSIAQTFDGGLIIAGRSFSNDGDLSNNHGNSDYWIVKLSASPIGIDEINLDDEIKFTPNPTSALMKIETTQNIDHIDLFNLLGEKVPAAVDCRLRTVDCSLLPPGIYILQASGEGKVWRGKVVKE